MILCLVNSILCILSEPPALFSQQGESVSSYGVVPLYSVACILSAGSKLGVVIGFISFASFLSQESLSCSTWWSMYENFYLIYFVQFFNCASQEGKSGVSCFMLASWKFWNLCSPSSQTDIFQGKKQASFTFVFRNFQCFLLFF